MGRVKSSFTCTQCGSVQLRWMGKCPDCGAWDSLEEVRLPAGGKAGSSGRSDPQRGLAEDWMWSGGQTEGEDGHEFGEAAEVGFNPTTIESPRSIPLAEIEALEVPRIATRISEFDRVLGGGFVPGSVVLLGGEPGIGKSTLMLQAAAQMAHAGRRVLYVTSEESAQQSQMRAQRLELPNDEGRLLIFADTNLARIFEQVRQVRPDVLIIDSVQMVYKSTLDASPGSMTQLRRCCMELVYLAKSSGCCVTLVGHVTKEGRMAGPRLLEHLVDSVIYFEGDQFHAHRLVRAVKNRYGNTREIGLFEMTERGLNPITDPTGMCWSAVSESDDDNRSPTPRPGSIIAPIMQGSRCFLVEIQALTATGILGAAKRRVSGLDANRMQMLIAVLEKYAEFRLADQDVFASSVGGLKVIEPASDLAVALAVAGAHFGRAAEAKSAAIGEVGLGGEIRRVSHLNQRLREAARLGFEMAIVPNANSAAEKSVDGDQLRILPVANVNAAIEHLV